MLFLSQTNNFILLHTLNWPVDEILSLIKMLCWKVFHFDMSTPVNVEQSMTVGG